MCKSSFTVFFEDPFWVGIYERQEDECLRVCKVVFGAEPKDAEVYLFLLDKWAQLVFGPPIEAMGRRTEICNPKRRQRAIAKHLAAGGVGTKAQQAVKLAQMQGKQARKAQTKKKKQEEQERQFALRTQKKKEKHKGH